MKKNIIIAAVSTALLLVLTLGSCELFEGIPERDNINDPDNVTGIELTFVLEAGNDNIKVSWSYEGSDENKHQIFYSTGTDIDTADASESFADGAEYTITELELGETYNIWLQAVENESGDVIFTKYGSAKTITRGELETEFSEDGIHVISDNDSDAYEVISAGDGEFYVGGSYSGDPTEYYNIIYKMDTAGAMVTDFADNGRFESASQPASAPKLNFVMLNSGTELNVFTVNNSNYIQFYSSLNSGDGTTTTATMLTQKNSAVDNEGKVIACGQHNSNMDFNIKRLSADFMGFEDEFNLDSTVIIPAASSSIATSIAVTDDNKIYAAGYADYGSTYSYLGRFNYDSLTLEESFNINQTSWLNHGELLTAVNNDGNILLAGNERLCLYDSISTELVSDFGTSGVANGIDSYFIPSDIKIQDDNKILLAGTINALNGCVYRINADGTKDESFGSNGEFILENYMFKSMDILSDGHIVVAAKDLTNINGAVILLK